MWWKSLSDPPVPPLLLMSLVFWPNGVDCKKMSSLATINAHTSPDSAKMLLRSQMGSRQLHGLLFRRRDSGTHIRLDFRES